MRFLLFVYMVMFCVFPLYGLPVDPYSGHIKALMLQYAILDNEPVLLILPKTQTLHVYEHNRRIQSFTISTSKYGLGSKAGSLKTPLGVHRISDKIGDNAPIGTVFKYRVQTTEILTDLSDQSQDYITTRILRLTGLEEGKNKGGNRDSYARCIYIHGTADENNIGRPSSHGCIRMTNEAVIVLFNRVQKGTIVSILHDA